jgi:lysophospholipase
VAKAISNASYFEDHKLLSSDGSSQLFVRQFGSLKPKLHFIVVHGALEHFGRHLDLIQFLTHQFGQDVAVTAYDQIGHGRSGGVRAYCSDFRIYVDDLKKIGELAQKRNTPETKTFILAHSLGGLVTLTRVLDPAYGWDLKIEGLIFSSPCIRPQMALGVISEPVLNRLSRLSGKIHLPMLYRGRDLTHDPEAANNFDVDTLIPKFITVGMSKQIVDASHRIRGLSYYLKIPSLFLIAGADKIVDSESTTLFAQGIDKRLTQIVHYPGLHHELWNEVERFDIFETMKKWIIKTLKEKP